jgi:GT2 family glycosyltransferase
MGKRLPVTLVIPTFQRGEILLQTLERVRALSSQPNEILLIDQTPEHPEEVAAQLRKGENQGLWQWIGQSKPSIPKAMNQGLVRARNELVLFCDDDVVPCEDWVAVHFEAHHTLDCGLVAGQVLLAGESLKRGHGNSFSFASETAQWVEEYMGGNFSVRRSGALEVGGFDENFHGAAYRFEAEFAARWLASGRRIWFEPKASVVHLQYPAGGVRAHGDHRRTLLPFHSVGEYYYWLVARGRPVPWRQLLSRPLRAVRTKHHLRQPWWIPGTLLAELVGLVWALGLALRGPRLLGRQDPKQ